MVLMIGHMLGCSWEQCHMIDCSWSHDSVVGNNVTWQIVAGHMTEQHADWTATGTGTGHSCVAFPFWKEHPVVTARHPKIPHLQQLYHVFILHSKVRVQGRWVVHTRPPPHIPSTVWSGHKWCLHMSCDFIATLGPGDLMVALTTVLLDTHVFSCQLNVAFN